MRNAVIKSVAAYAPEQVIPNSYFDEILGEDVNTWLVENLTIRERRWCGKKESTVDISVNAANLALERAEIKSEELDLIILSTDTPEYISPSTASVVQYRLNAVNAGTFDINTACAGFVTALDVGSKFIRADDSYNNILVIGAYAMSKYLDLTDKKTVTLFADGAGAVVLTSESSVDTGFQVSELYSEGKYHDWMGIYAGGTYMSMNSDVLDRKDHLLKFVRKFPKEINPATWTKMVKNNCDRINISPGDIDHYFMTQININSIRQTLDYLGVPHEKAHTIMDCYGYTGSACIPMTLNDAYEKGKLNRGERILFIGSGGGLAFACAIFNW